MGTAFALLPIAVVLLTALSRVHAIRGAAVIGTIERETALTVLERMRYHRASLYALATVLLVGTLGGANEPATLAVPLRGTGYGILALEPAQARERALARRPSGPSVA